jgi:hypothetical protein
VSFFWLFGRLKNALEGQSLELLRAIPRESMALSVGHQQNLRIALPSN